jgi:hypothetical protein
MDVMLNGVKPLEPCLARTQEGLDWPTQLSESKLQ